MYIGRLPAEIMQSVYALDDRCKSCGDLGIGGVRPVLFAINNVAVNRGMKSLLHLARVAGKVDHRAAVSNLDNLEPVRSQP